MDYLVDKKFPFNIVKLPLSLQCDVNLCCHEDAEQQEARL